LRTPTKVHAVEIGLGPSERAPVDPSRAAGLGSTVEVEDLATGAQLTYRLVEVHQAAPKDGLLSIASPVGAALRAHHVGEVVTAATPRGRRALRIVSIG
jgi:transcription elongation factor GreA